MLDPKDPDLGFVWLYEDITARHNAEAALIQHEPERVRALVLNPFLRGASSSNEIKVLRMLYNEGSFRHTLIFFFNNQ